MTGILDADTTQLPRQRVLSLLLLCALTFWLAMMAGTYRTSNRLFALTMLAGVVVLACDLLLLAKRISNAMPPRWSNRAVEGAARWVPILLLGLIAISALAAAFGYVNASTLKLPLLERALSLTGELAARALFGLLLVGAAGGLLAGTTMVLGYAALRWPPVARTGAIVDRVVVGATALYCAWALLLTLNGSFDRSRVSTEHRGEIVKVWGFATPSLWWADIRRVDAAGGFERVLLVPERDRVVPTLVSEGQRVRVRVRAGIFGLAWVESLRLDTDYGIAELVAAAPSAATPRQQLIELLLRDGRWAEAAAQAAIYARYHPRDRELVKRVAGALRAAKQTEPAAELDRMIASVAPPQGVR